MASISTSYLIFFITGLVVAGVVSATLFTQVTELDNSISDRADQASENIETDITIISDQRSDRIANTSTNKIELYIKNTGVANLMVDVRELDVLVNGAFVPNGDLSIQSVSGSNDRWGTGTTVKLTIEGVSISPGDIVEVGITAGGSQSSFSFRAD